MITYPLVMDNMGNMAMENGPCRTLYLGSSGSGGGLHLGNPDFCYGLPSGKLT